MAIVLVVFVLLLAFGALVLDRRRFATSLTTEADDAMRTLRGVARKRVREASIPMPVELDDTKPVALPIGPRLRVVNGEYSQHKKKGP